MQTKDEIVKIYIAWKCGAKIESRWGESLRDMQGMLPDEFFAWDEHESYIEAVNGTGVESLCLYDRAHGVVSDDVAIQRKVNGLEFRLKPKENKDASE